MNTMIASIKAVSSAPLYLLYRILTNKNKNLFTVRLGVTLLLGKFGIVGPIAAILSPIVRGFLGLLIEDGTFLIDVSLDAYREGKKLKEFEKAADLAYKKATAKIYDEAEKQKIRKQYLDIISKIGVVGSGPK
jgi:hypothetical protein